MGGPGGLTVGSQKRCNECVDKERKTIGACDLIKADKFKKMKTPKLRSGENANRLKGLLKSRKKPDDKLDYSGTDHDPSDIVIPPPISKQQKEAAAKKVKSFMDSEDTLRTMTHGSKVVPAARMIENPVNKGKFGMNRMSDKPSLTSSYGGARKKRKKTKRRRKSKKSRRTRRRRR